MGKKFDINYVLDFIPKLLSYLDITLFIVTASLVFGLLIGFLVALPRMYNVPVLKRVSQVYVSFFRGTPILIQLFLVYYGVPELFKLVNIDLSRTDVLVFVILSYSLHSGAFISEGIRAAVNGVERGQVEAAYSVGMNGFQAFTRIILPQALAISVPIFANLTIANLKDTSLAFTLGAMEMTGKSQTLGTATQHFIETYIALSLIYFVISTVLERAFHYVERRLLKHEKQLVQHGHRSRKRSLWGKPLVTRIEEGG
ncbi:amino acid ABC transporter permease [Paenibacillus gorillae]|uniref:amino acid ABC transporter permease n=1 Tax=Paenibacillus gorillae TaxID=1243662 RepID=UPI0004B32EED|nr:amino acid ABC transporter permease [Paenibacillus gorillae]